MIDPSSNPTPLQFFPIISVQSEWQCTDVGALPHRHYQIIVNGSRVPIPDGIQCSDGDILLIVSKEDWAATERYGLMIYYPCTQS